MPHVYFKFFLTSLTVLIALTAFLPGASAESLVRASVQMEGQPPIMSRSLFTPPISRQVGDLVVILVDQTIQQDTSAELKITRTQAINENGSSLFNNMVGFMLGKLPFGTSGVSNALKAPSFNGMNNSNTLDSKAESTHATTLQDIITCQVTQVLPNGNLMVQGEKILLINKERQNLMVTGIIRPYYLDMNNQISSKLVGNLQMVQGGKGVISRQQNDSFANKVYQFFN